MTGVAVRPEPTPTDSGGGGGSGHRTDIDALRALAVVLVVLFHLGIERFRAGFIGVDVFFVLSGYLITGLLDGELTRTGTIGLGRFWARRIRRLLPAATFVLAVVAIASRWLTSPLVWARLGGSIVAALTYVSNFFFASQQADYFAADVKDNPVLHFWSLSVEEQFYLVWPVIFFLVGLAVPAARRRRAMMAVAATLLVASLAYSFVATGGGGPLAYYSPLSRAWEFLAGGLLAMVTGGRPVIGAGAGAAGGALRPVLVRALAASAGVGLILIGLLSISPTSGFPAPTAALPVVGTLLFLAVGLDRREILGRLLAFEPIQYVGRLSYSWYLWHWPFLVIGKGYLGTQSHAVGLALVAASFVAAALTHRLIENPVRFAPRLQTTGASYLLLAGLAVVGLVSAGTLVVAERAIRHDPDFQAVEQADDVWYRDQLEGFRCATSDLAVLERDCVFGDSGSGRTVLVLGDSNAEHWLPALDTQGRRDGYRVMLRVYGACPVQALESPFSVDPGACRTLQRETAQVVAELKPDAVLVAQIGRYVDVVLSADRRELSAEARRALWEDATVTFLDSLGTTPVGWIHSTPVNDQDPRQCLAWKDEASCETSRADATRASGLEREWSEAAFTRAANQPRSIQTDVLLCPPDRERCPVRLDDGRLIYYDDNHLTVAAAERFGADLGPMVNALLDR